MGTKWGCSDNTKWNPSIMDQQIKSLNVVEQNENSLPEMDIRRGTPLDGSDTERTGGECYTICEYPTVKMDKSYIPYIKRLDKQMAQDNGLFRSQQATQSQSFYYGRYQNTKTIVVRQRLDNKSGHRIRIPSRVGKRRTSTLSRHAPWVFHKTMRPVMKLIRDQLQIRSVAYCDDLIFICQSQQELMLKTNQIIEMLENFGWKINHDKSTLIPTQQIEYLGWFLDTEKDGQSMTETRKKEMITTINKWRRMMQNRKIVQVRWLASLIGKLNFLRLQIK
ncbi:MAG: hypothetical protein EZS28_022420 [Streblomastix strix]|uniref:Reverse transcriptase domain-containing protein n=1 Tax=Streblomastix strix TaxID=222440 RepID=A0A5J4VHM9_9EUKA|nr:MAG: hypothetical protein EZS28_022420 [Streblomastix strix]